MADKHGRELCIESDRQPSRQCLPSIGIEGEFPALAAFPLPHHQPPSWERSPSPSAQSSLARKLTLSSK